MDFKKPFGLQLCELNEGIEITTKADMKKLLTSTSSIAIAVAISAGSVFAADLAPVTVNVSDWTGPYLGVHVGATIPNSKNGWNPGISVYCESTCPSETQWFRRPVNKIDKPGAMVGGTLGYDHQFDNWIIGIDGSFSGVWQRHNTYYYDDCCDDNSNPALEITNSERAEFRVNALASVRAKLGFAFGEDGDMMG
jgi:opacity protein-like surface antigen